MRIDRIGSGATYLVPKSGDALRIGVLPGTGDGIAVAITVDTENVGSFVIPVDKYQLGTIVAVANWLLKLDATQAAELRARLTRELQEESNEGNQENE